MGGEKIVVNLQTRKNRQIIKLIKDFMRHLNRILALAIVLLLPLSLSTVGVKAQFGNTPPLHVEGNQLKDPHGNTVVLHGVMDTPSPYFNSYRWGNSCTSSTVTPCINYFNKLFTAITDTTSGAYCNLFRLHLDPCWTNDPNKPRTGSEASQGLAAIRAKQISVSLVPLASRPSCVRSIPASRSMP